MNLTQMLSEQINETLKGIESNKTLSDFMKLLAEMRFAFYERRPHGDITPLFVVQFKSGETTTPKMPWDIADTAEGKQLLSEAIGHAVSMDEVVRVGLLVSTYSTLIQGNADGSPIDPADRPIPREATNRKEVLVLHVVDQIDEESWVCEINRNSEHIPSLDEWAESVGRVDGLWADTLRKVRVNKTMGEIVSEIIRS